MDEQGKEKTKKGSAHIAEDVRGRTAGLLLLRLGNNCSNVAIVAQDRAGIETLSLSVVHPNISGKT